MKQVSTNLLRASMPSSTGIRQALTAVRDTIVACDRCTRLRTYCQNVAEKKKRAYLYDTYWGRPVPGFGSRRARAARGPRTCRPRRQSDRARLHRRRSGGSGDFLMGALHRAGFANIPTSQHAADGLRLSGAYITSAVRCAPPGNKRSARGEQPLPRSSRRRSRQLRHVRVVVGLGRIAFDAWLQLLRRRGAVLSPRPTFGHGVVIECGEGWPLLVGCYHPSRQNTNTAS